VAECRVPKAERNAPVGGKVKNQRDKAVLKPTVGIPGSFHKIQLNCPGGSDAKRLKILFSALKGTRFLRDGFVALSG